MAGLGFCLNEALFGHSLDNNMKNDGSGLCCQAAWFWIHWGMEPGGEGYIFRERTELWMHWFLWNQVKKKIWFCVYSITVYYFLWKKLQREQSSYSMSFLIKKKSQTVQHQRAQRSPHWLWTLSFFLIFTQKQPLHVLTVLPSWLPTPHTLCPFFTSGFSQLTVTSSKIGNH